MSYEQLLALMQARRSIRRFAQRAVGRAEIEALFEAARWAPSNHNRQGWKFLVLEEPGKIQALAAAVEQQLAGQLKALPSLAASYAQELVAHAAFIGQAPLLILALHKQPVSLSHSLLAGLDQPWLVSGEPLSTAMAVQNLLLAAHARGLGACVLTAPLIAGAAIARHVAMPAGFELTCFVAVGYPDETPPTPRRKNLAQIVEYR